jgi:hypothetical protein
VQAQRRPRLIVGLADHLAQRPVVGLRALGVVGVCGQGPEGQNVRDRRDGGGAVPPFEMCGDRGDLRADEAAASSGRVHGLSAGSGLVDAVHAWVFVPVECALHVIEAEAVPVLEPGGDQVSRARSVTM